MNYFPFKMPSPVSDPRAPQKAAIPADYIKVPSKLQIARSFGRRAATYRDHAVVQADLIGRIVGLIAAGEAAAELQEGPLIDVGCGTGLLADLCREAGIRSGIVGIDLAFGALAGRAKTGNPFLHLAADMEHLPFRPQAFRGAIAASVLQWLDSPTAALREIAAMLKPGGNLLFSVFIEGSFAELAATRALYGLPSPVRCPSPGDFESSLREAGFDHICYESVTHTIFAADAKANLKSISAIGGSATEGPLLTRAALRDFCRSYDERFRTEKGVPLTYKSIIGMCRLGL